MLQNSLNLKYVHVPNGEGLPCEVDLPSSPEPGLKCQFRLLLQADVANTADRAMESDGGLAPSFIVHCTCVFSYLGPRLSESLSPWCPFLWDPGLPLL